MPKKPRELLFLLLSLILLVGTALLYLTQGNRHHNQSSERPKRSEQVKASTQPTDEAITAFEADLVQAESTPNSDTLTELLERFKTLPDHPSKKESEQRLTQLKQTIEQIETASKAVRQAETSRLPNDIEQAQEKVNLVTSTKDRSALQERLAALVQQTQPPAPLPSVDTPAATIEAPVSPPQPVIEEAPSPVTPALEEAGEQ